MTMITMKETKKSETEGERVIEAKGELPSRERPEKMMQAQWEHVLVQY